MIQTAKINYATILGGGVRVYPRLHTAIGYKGRLTNFSFPSIVDSGADCCMFPIEIAKEIGLKYNKVRPVKAKGLGGNVECYYHKIEVVVDLNGPKMTFSTIAGFTRRLHVGLLGRSDFFKQFKSVAFDENNSFLELSYEYRNSKNSKVRL